jgi:hypothetical protein
MKRTINGDRKDDTVIINEESCVQRVQQDLWIRLRGSGANNLGYLSQVEADIRSRLDLAFQQKMSTSLLVVGPAGSGKKDVIDSVLQSYTNDHAVFNTNNDGSNDGSLNVHQTPFSVARVQGQVCTSDQEALCSIAGQLCLRPTTGRDLSLALEDLEDHFRQCALNGRPSVIVLQDVHAFATREKQVLIYTLLDYMHKSDMLFVVLGCTPCAHLQYLLEKRVLSRLNAQFVYVPPASGQNVCDVLARRLMLDITGNDTEQNYRKQFNKRVVELFGKVDEGTCKKKIRGSTQKSDPELLHMIKTYTDWGKGLSHFLRVAQLAVCRLTPEQPYLKSSHITQALYAQDPCTLLERLSSLPLFELHIFASVARLYGRLGNNSNTKKNSSTGSKGPLSPGGVRVEDVLEELEKLTGTFRRKESTRPRALLGLTALVQEGLINLYGGVGKSTSSRLVTEETLVQLNPPIYEVQEAFHSNIDSQVVGRERMPLVISDRVRRAVLEPLENVLVNMDGALGLIH